MTPELLVFCLELWRGDTWAAPTLPALVDGFELHENGAITDPDGSLVRRGLWSLVYSERATLARGRMTPEIRARISALSVELRELADPGSTGSRLHVAGPYPGTVLRDLTTALLSYHHTLR